MDSDTSPLPNTLQGLLAVIRAAPARSSDIPAQRAQSPGLSGLLSILRNTSFFPAEFQDVDADNSQDENEYDDLPALEDEHTPTFSQPAHVVQPIPSQGSVNVEHPDEEDDLPALEPASSSTPRSPIRATRGIHPSAHLPDNVAISNLSIADATSSNAAEPATAPLEQSGAPRVSPAPRRANSTTPLHRADDDNDHGAESDSSMPSLNTVSDTSDDDDDSYVGSEPGWDDNSDEYDSDAEDDIPQFPMSQAAAGPSPATPSSLGPHSSPNATDRADPFQAYRALLERARSFLPQGGVHMQNELLASLAASINTQDPERAETLLAGMEKVPDDLVRRYKRLRMADGDDGDGCAICRDDLLDDLESQVGTPEQEQTVLINAALPFHVDPNHVVAFPCSGKHLFHRDCLSPWLAQKTTCPSCRFDIDPHSLTLKRPSEWIGDDVGLPDCVWRPPQVEPMMEWLEAEERVRATGVPRQRPEVVMPTYPFGPSLSTDEQREGIRATLSIAEMLASIDTEMINETTNAAAAEASPPDATSATGQPLSAGARFRRAQMLHDQVHNSEVDPHLLPPHVAEDLRREHEAVLEARAARLRPPPNVSFEMPPPPGHVPYDIQRHLRSMRRAFGLPPDYHDHDDDDDAGQPNGGGFQTLFATFAPTAAPQDVHPASDDGAQLMPPLQDGQVPAAVPTLTGPNIPIFQALNLAAPPIPPANVDADGQGTANVFDAGEIPPPIQADPNQALPAVAPLVLDADYMRALIETGLAGPGSNGDAPAPPGTNWADSLD